MKKLLFIALLFASSASFAQQQINWMSIEEAVEAQKTTPKKIVMDVYTQWCGPCKMMMKNTFTNVDVIEYVNENFYAVKFDAEGPDPVLYKGKTYDNPGYKPELVGRRNGVHNFSRAMGVNAYPTLVYLDEDSNVITSVSGYKDPKQLEVFLKLFATDKYKSITTQEQAQEYYSTFVNEFK